jgi:xanthine dehydrogenase accessory factor
LLNNKLILVKGAGDFASGSIRRLHLAGAKVVCTELPQPLTIRRMVSFSEAIYSGEHTVEGVTGIRVTVDELEQCFTDRKVPVLDDPDTNIQHQRDFDIVIDARMAKKNLGTTINDAPIVIGLGPGFDAGEDCHAVIETLAGHNLGRVIYSGKAADDTGIPAPLDQNQYPCQAAQEPCCAGFDMNTLVLRAPNDGKFISVKQIGDLVETKELIGSVNDQEVRATEGGVLRGLIHDGVEVFGGLKIGDIDPTGDTARVYQISEKANAIAGGVLEACLYLLNNKST